MDIVERLKRVKYTRERNDAPNGFSWDEPCDADDYGAEQRFVNPDGPEAADEIERLRKVLQEIADKDGWCSAKAVAKRLREAGYVDINTIYKMAEEAADEIERLRKVNVMQARWLHEAQQEHKKFKDYVRQLLSVENAALKDSE